MDEHARREPSRATWYTPAIAIIVVFIIIGLPLIKACEFRQNLERDINNLPTISVQEDEPGWDCRVYGNQVCGR